MTMINKLRMLYIVESVIKKLEEKYVFRHHSLELMFSCNITVVHNRHKVNSILEFELMDNSRMAYLKNNNLN